MHDALSTTADDRDLARIAEKVRADRRLDLADGIALFACRDVHALGRLADGVRRRRHGDGAYYNINCHINYTNVCTLQCGVCGYARREGQDGAYELAPAEVARRAAQAAAAGATEIHMTGGLHPCWTLDNYEDMVRQVRQAAPRAHIKAFTAVEIDHIATMSGVSAQVVLQRLQAAGLDSLPGGGAEIFDPQVRAALFPLKMPAQRWLEVHREAHHLGMRSNATMLYGHIESPKHRVEHLLALRDLQDQTGGFQALVPLAFVPVPRAGASDDADPGKALPGLLAPGLSGGALSGEALSGEALENLQGPTAIDDLRTVAVSRLILDNVEHIKTFWIMHGLKLSQLALHWGADDIDGTVTQYQIVESKDHSAVSAGSLRQLITEAGFTPVERDSLYRPI